MKKSEIQTIRKEASAAFRNQLAGMGVKKTKLEDLCAGFEDGMSAMLHALRQAGALTLED